MEDRMNKIKSDTYGFIVSAICLIHCMVSPLLFLAQVNIATIGFEHSVLWTLLEVALLAVSFAAVYRSAKKTHIRWIKYAFFVSWAVLFIAVINEQLAWVQWSHAIIYIPSVCLIILHLYNKRQCSCEVSSGDLASI
jgi:hypothetical protein